MTGSGCVEVQGQCGELVFFYLELWISALAIRFVQQAPLSDELSCPPKGLVGLSLSHVMMEFFSSILAVGQA